MRQLKWGCVQFLTRVDSIIRQFHAIKRTYNNSTHHSHTHTHTQNAEWNKEPYRCVYIHIQITHSVFNYFILRFISFRLDIWSVFVVENERDSWNEWVFMWVRRFIFSLSLLSLCMWVSLERINRPIPALRYWSHCVSNPFFLEYQNVYIHWYIQFKFK